MKKISKHPSFVYADDLKEICQPLNQLGINYFSQVLVENDQFSAIGMKPEFVKIYYEKKYYNFDIHQAKISQQADYILWDGMYMDPQLAALHDDFKSFSLGHGFTMVKQVGDCRYYYHFSASLGERSMNHTYLENLDFLNNFILYFNEKMNAHRDLKKAYDIKFMMEEKINIECPHSSLPLKRIYFSHDQYLTPRELECLHGLASGKTIDEIAANLSITARTMNAHIAVIKQKLNCTNLFQLGEAYRALGKISL